MSKLLPMTSLAIQQKTTQQHVESRDDRAAPTATIIDSSVLDIPKVSGGTTSSNFNENMWCEMPILNNRVAGLGAILLVAVTATFFRARISLPRPLLNKNGWIKQDQSSSPQSYWYERKHNASYYEKPIFFTHFHKSGGSSVCQTIKKVTNITLTDAQDNRLRSSNCNAPYSGPRSNVSKFQQVQTCDELIPLTTDENGRPFHRLNFIAVEVPFKEPMPCHPGQYRSFAIMREPVARVLSHMTFHGWNETILSNWMANRTPNPPHTYMKGYPIVNCMVIRQLLGRDRYRNVRLVDENDFQRAIELVNKFDAVVPLEYLHHPHVSQLLNVTVPEYYHGLLQKNISAKHQKTRYQPSEEFRKQVAEENYYDSLLYEYVLERLEIKS